MNNYEKENRKITLEESINLLNKQDREISRLKSELTAVLNERDLLLCEVSKLKFELEIVDLKRIHDDRIPCLKGKDLLRGSVNSSQDCEDDLEPRDGDIVDDDVDHYIDHRVKRTNSPGQTSTAAFICHMWHNNTGQGGIKKKGSICGANDNNVKHFRIIQNGYELSQDLLDKHIELLERKYGGVKARKAAFIIQRAFRRYTLRKKFAHITAMAKAEKRLSRRFQFEQHESPTAITSSTISSSDDVNNFSVVSNVNDTAMMRTIRCSGGQSTATAVVGSGAALIMATPVRSLSMREKRMADLENGGTNSLPRMYSAQCNGYPNYCCNTVPVACSHMCTSVYSDVYSNVDYREHNNRLELPRKSQCYACPTHSASLSTQVQNYQMSSMCSSTTATNYNNVTTKRIVNQQAHHHHYQQSNSIIHNNNNNNNSSSPIIGNTSTSSYHQINVSHSSPSQMSTPVKKVPPEVPKRTSSISLRSVEGNQNNNSSICSNASSNDMSFGKTHYSGSMSSVQSSSSGDSSNAAMNVYNNSFNSGQTYSSNPDWSKKMQQLSETLRKRQYRVGLNLFNKKPEKGVTYLMRKGFLENSPQAVAKFLIARKGLSKQMIGEYLGNVQDSFNSAVLECFARELDLSGMQVDVALRKFQTYFRMPGEAQKIERLMEVFSHRYCQCNRDVVSKLRTLDTVFVLAFAIIMLNTDLHTPNLKADRRMKLQDFIKNLRGVDDCCDIDHDMLVGIYERIKVNEFKPGSDHVSQVMKVQSTIIGKKPNLAVSHRRLVCYCRLYEVPDINKKDKPGLHQREVFLFNDLLVITKILSKKKNSVTYTFRQSFSLSGLNITIFQTSHYLYGIRLSQRVDNRVLVAFNARNEHDRSKFVDDIRESILEMDEMENIRIESELERQKNARSNRCNGGPNSNENRDSGVADVEVCPCLQSSTPIKSNKDSPSKSCSMEQNGGLLKRSALSNSLIDIHDQDYRPQRNGSVGSLDSGMSITFASNKAKDASPLTTSAANNNAAVKTSHQQSPSFLAGIFNKRL